MCIGPDDGGDSETLLKNAETAIYRAKSSGRNQLCCYTEDLNANALERLRLEADLRVTLTRHQVSLRLINADELTCIIHEHDENARQCVVHP